jgi:hypothetical protein
VIYWKDFAFDEVFGPLLVVSESEKPNGAAGIRNDAVVKIQETRQEQRPARMVGTLHAMLVDDTGMEAGRDLRTGTDSIHSRGES